MRVMFDLGPGGVVNVVPVLQVGGPPSKTFIFPSIDAAVAWVAKWADV